ncbi:MAG TPA: hypothetical protein VHV55_06800 [Pirellulales bacterium]|jgi:hypothetical protein|nr:hypothetical protein [Pirellulales bacterium]
MSTPRIAGIGWLALTLVALAAPVLSAAGPKEPKAADKAVVATPPKKAAPAKPPQGAVRAEPQVRDEFGCASSGPIEKALDQPTEIEFIEAPLTDVIDFLKKRHKIEIQLDNKALEESGVALDTQITRNVKGISLRSALRLILRDLELAYVIRDDVLLITTQSNAETILMTRVYQVADLLGTPDDEILRLNPADDLIELLTTIVAPTTWSDVGGAGAISYLPAVQSLFISQTYEIHEEICELFATVRKLPATTAAPADATAADGKADKMFVVTYLLKPTPAAHRAPLQPGNDQNAALQAQVEAASKRALTDDLARTVPKTIEPASWKDGGGQGVIESIGVGVVVRQTRHVQIEVARFLNTVGLSVAPAEVGFRNYSGGSSHGGQF